MMKYYTGNHTGDVPGNLPSPYYWWEAGAFFGAMVISSSYAFTISRNKLGLTHIRLNIGTIRMILPIMTKVSTATGVGIMKAGIEVMLISMNS